MSGHELTFTRVPTRNSKGQFMKGCTSFVKGKTWDEYMPKSSQERCAKGWANLKKRKGNFAFGGWNKRAVVAITEDGLFVGRFESAKEASRQSGVRVEEIYLVCSPKVVKRKKISKKLNKTYTVTTVRKFAGKTTGGRRLRWFYEDDDKWIEFLNNND
ncbi:MAG: hypothetical protein LBT56_08790 [Prevotellaceae bacterium]|jgi:hypothetical protein|nr:hypothetical protein [Prevotellaceae bacterium]